MKLKYYLGIVAALIMQWGVVWAQGPEMNKVYTVPMGDGFSGNNSFQIPASAFLADATSAVVTVKDFGSWGILRNGAFTSDNFAQNEYGVLSVSYEFSGANLEVARSNNLYVNCDANAKTTVTVLNKDANYVAPSPGPGGTGGSGDPDPDYVPDYSFQQDTDDDGKLNPDAEHPAFGVMVDYNQYPQLTDVPSMYITVYKTDDQGVTYDETKTMDISTTKNDWYYQCRIVIADKHGNMKQRDEMVGLRGRGNSTWTWVNSGKRAFRLKFPSKTKLLAEQDENYNEVNNYADAKSWTLMANAFDKTLIHNAFTYEMGKNKLTNLPFCPAYRFVDLFVNNVYYGTYQVSDQVQVDKKRVNVNSSTGWFLEITASKGGAFLEAPYVTVDGGKLYANVKNPEDATEGTETFTAIQNYMTSLHGKLSSTYDYGHDFSFKTGYRTLVDMPSLIDWFIGEEISANYDGTFGNIYAYREAENDKLHFGPMWDLDIAYGGHEGAAMSKIHIWDNSMHQWEGMSNMMRTLYSDKYFVRDLYERWKVIYDNGDLKTFCEDKINMLADIVRQSQEKNYTIAKPFGISAIGISTADNMGGSFASYDAAIEYFKNYVTARIDWLNTEYATQYSTLGCATLNPCADFGHNDGYVKQDDGSYRKGCDVCGTVSDTDTHYYEFTVYPESKNTEIIMATSWKPSEEKPNSIAVVEAKQEVVETIEGWNIIAGKKNADGNLTCKDFRLTDGHPYYGDNKFVATNATYTRSITDRVGTVCLPYKQQNAIITGAKLYHLSSVSSEEMVLKIIEPEIEGNASAYVPVVFVAEENVNELTFTGENVTVKKLSALEPYYPMADNETWSFVGTMEKTVFEDVTKLKDENGAQQYLYYLSGDSFYRATKKFTCNPFRAYFLSDTDLFSSSALSHARLRIVTEDELGIQNIINDDQNWDNAIHVSSLVLPLPTGKYIINGRNVIINK